MMRKRALALVAATVLALTVSGCVDDAQPPPSGPGSTSPGVVPSVKAADAAVGAVLRPTKAKGGTLRFGMVGDWDSVDPGDTYDTVSWNFLRNYARTLTVFKAVPGQSGLTLVPDLATSLGTPSDDNTTWTYTLRTGIRFEDGTPITSKDIKYAVARSLDKRTLPNGPTYWNDYLAGVPAGYSVYRDRNLDDLTAIDTPDAKTIVFHLRNRFTGFDYLASLPSTAPVPAAKDTGANYRTSVVSSGPYKFTAYEPGQRYELDRNPNYDPLTDPVSGRTALPNNITVELGLAAADVDARLQSGDLDVDMTGEGVTDSTRVALLASSTLKARTDSAPSPSSRLTALNSHVAPLDNRYCRQAVVLGYDKVAYLTAVGGSNEGAIATSVLPPARPGRADTDLYRFTGHPEGDLAGARDALKRCGRPSGFAVNLAYRSDRPRDQAVAESLRQSLGRVGIILTARAYPASDFNRGYAGNTAYARANRLGLTVYGWRADWPDGVGFLGQILDSLAPRPAAGSPRGATAADSESLLAASVALPDGANRAELWAKADRTVMQNAGVIPGVWGRPLLYRPDTLANVFVNQAFNQYDYAALGTLRR